MLDLVSGRSRTCDGLTRRGFLRVGSLGMGGLTLADALRLRSQAAESGLPTRDTAVIQVVLGGGPSQIETWDPKPDAPAEFRGEFKPVATNVPGIFLGEMFRGQARLMDKLAVVRSLHHEADDHNIGSHWIMTGFKADSAFQPTNGRPSVGSIVARMKGSNASGLPAYVAVPGAPLYAQAAYLGAGFNPFRVDGDPSASARVRNLVPPEGLDLDRIDDRRQLLAQLDRIERRRDATGMMDGLDRFAVEANAMVTGKAARRAFDLTTEDPRLRDRYGRTKVGQSCLLARRLVEAGVTFVTVNEPGWDHHGQVFQACRRQLPPLDAAIAALIEDLHDRGLNRRVLLVVWGEFGRTPRLNGSAGRDHWPNAMSAVLAGGGLKVGQVIGATNRNGERPVDRPLRPEDLIRTIYHVLGLDPSREFPDDSGRPRPVLNAGEPIAELI
jgi:hypothetical protein